MFFVRTRESAAFAEVAFIASAGLSPHVYASWSTGVVSLSGSGRSGSPSRACISRFIGANRTFPYPCAKSNIIFAHRTNARTAHAPHRGSCTADSTLRSILKLFTHSFFHFIHSVPLASFAVYPRVSREHLDEAQKTSSHVIHLLTAVYEGSHCLRRSDPCPRVGCKLRAVKCTTQRREHFLR